jgi:hypothetical protein
MKIKSLIGSLALLTFVVFAGPAKAVLLPPGTPPVTPDNLTLLPHDLTLDVQASAFINPTFSTTLGTTHGIIASEVFRNPTTGFLDFVYQISNDATSLDALFRGTATDFSSLQGTHVPDVGYTTNGSGLAGAHFVNGTVQPTTVDRLNSSGDTVGFNFTTLGTLMPGATSLVLVIETDATGFTLGHFSVIDGGVATVDAWEPVVPDGGTTVALLGIALAGLEGVRRMFRARKA